MKKSCFKKYVRDVQPNTYEQCLFYPNYLTGDCSDNCVFSCNVTKIATS